MNRCALHEKGWRSGLIPYLEIKTVFTGGNVKLLRFSEL